MSAVQHPAVGATIARAGRRIFRVPPSLDYADWAEGNLRTESGARWKWYPYQVQPARDMFDPEISELSLCWYSGGGKTYMLGPGFAYGFVAHRAWAAAMFPGVLQGQKWLEEELGPILESCPALIELGIRQRSRDWHFGNGGKLDVVGSSLSTIRRLQADITYADEIDAIHESGKDEGSRLKNFFKRTRGRPIQRHWASSYPSVRGFSKIESLLGEAQTFRWWVDCPHCGDPWWMHTDHLRWESEDGEVRKAWVEHPECGATFEDSDRREFAGDGWWGLEEGEWVVPLAEAPKRRRRGYHLNCMAHQGLHDAAYPDYLAEIASQKAAIDTAVHVEEARRTFQNTNDAESYVPPAIQKPEPSVLFKNREKGWGGRNLPAEGLVLMAGVDVQKNRLEVTVIAVGRDGHVYVLAHRAFSGRYDQARAWSDAEKWLSRPWIHPVHGRMPLFRKQRFEKRKLNPTPSVLVDANWRPTKVYDQTRPRRDMGWFAIQSKDRVKLGRPAVIGTEYLAREKTWQVNLGVNTIKDSIMEGLTVPESARGRIHFPETQDFTEKYFEGLTAEEGVTTDDGHTRWVNTDKARNEPLDCLVYAWAGVRLLDPDIEAFEERLAAAKRLPRDGYQGKSMGSLADWS